MVFLKTQNRLKIRKQINWREIRGRRGGGKKEEGTRRQAIREMYIKTIFLQMDMFIKKLTRVNF